MLLNSNDCPWRTEDIGNLLFWCTFGQNKIKFFTQLFLETLAVCCIGSLGMLWYSDAIGQMELTFGVLIFACINFPRVQKTYILEKFIFANRKIQEILCIYFRKSFYLTNVNSLFFR